MLPPARRGIGAYAPEGRWKNRRREVGKMRRWEKARLRDGEAEESGELGEQTVLWIGNHIYLAS